MKYKNNSTNLVFEKDWNILVLFLHLIILRACIGIIWRLTIKLVLHKNRMRCVLRTRDEIEIYHHHHSIPCSGNPFKSMFPLQTPGFHRRGTMLPPGEETDYVRVHCRNVRRIISLRRFLCSVWLFQITREEDDPWHCASALVWVFRAEAHPHQPQPLTGNGVHLGESNRISLLFPAISVSVTCFGCGKPCRIESGAW